MQLDQSMQSSQLWYILWPYLQNLGKIEAFRNVVQLYLTNFTNTDFIRTILSTPSITTNP